jgi:hypothetical protein
MAHYAKLDSNNIVTEVVVVNNEVITVDGVESEQKGLDFLYELTGHKNWVKCSYNGNIRLNFPGIGMSYDKDRDAFITHKPYPDWVLDEETCRWKPPIEMPNDGKEYKWFTEEHRWIQINEV